MLQKLLGVCFFATIVVLSYVATLHIVTNRVDELHHNREAMQRARSVQMGGPVSLSPIGNYRPLKTEKPKKHSSIKPAKRKVASVAKSHHGKSTSKKRSMVSLDSKHKKSKKKK